MFMSRHWTINGRFLSQPVTGVQRYACEIVRALDGLLADQNPAARGLEIEILAPPSTEMPFPLLAIGSRSVGRIGGHAWEQFILPAHTRGSVLSLCNTGPLVTRKHIVCIHDANTFNVPESYSMAFRALYRILLPALGRTARSVSTVSGFSQSEIVRHQIAAEGKILIAPDGHEHALRWKPCHSIATRRAASRNTIVMIGSATPHKNSGLILGMCERLAAAGLTVAVVGLPDPRVFKKDGKRVDAGNVHWLGRISDEQLAALLRDSMCLAFPSFTEGFGLPALEAMAMGCPVVVADRASLPEVCGNAALYAPPTAADAWFKHFITLRDSEALRLQMIARGRAGAAKFSWRSSAMRYLRAMAAVDGIDFDDVSVQAYAQVRP
jgi:glycosyltransferase involved in cell wall biosynthesis